MTTENLIEFFIEKAAEYKAIGTEYCLEQAEMYQSFADFLTNEK